MCHGYKLAGLNWCCQLLPCFDGEKPGSLVTYSWSFTVAVTKNVQRNRTYVSVEIVRLSHVRAKQCSSTPSSWEVWDAWFHVPMSLSADTIKIFHQQTRLSSPSKQGSNWRHQLRLASLYPWHRVIHHDVSIVTTSKEYLINCHILLKYYEYFFSYSW